MKTFLIFIICLAVDFILWDRENKAAEKARREEERKKKAGVRIVIEYGSVFRNHGQGSAPPILLFQTRITLVQCGSTHI
jgi:hypothetical protein